MEMWERGKKRKVSASCEKQEVYHNNHRRLNMYMTDTEMLPKIINFCLYNINVTDFFSISIWNSEFYAGSKLRENSRVGGVCVRGMSFSHAKCGKLYHKVPPNHLSNTEESKQELCMFI